MMKRSKIKQATIRIQQKMFGIIHRLNYRYYLKHYPLLLQKMGINFSGDISKTGFISSTASFDSFDYAKNITIGERTIISSQVQMLVHDYSIGNAMLEMQVGGGACRTPSAFY